jgi:predicted cobalt transporter CbtA
MKTFITRGLAAGAVGGLATALFIRFVTERIIGFALEFEDATGIGLPHGAPAEFSRSTQHWGGMAGALLYGCVLGVVLAIAVAALHHRISAVDEFGRAFKVAVAGYLALNLIPALKYPPNPPTVGDPDTIGQRTTNYLVLMAASIAIVYIAFAVWSYLTRAGVVGALRFAAAGGAAAALLAFAFVAWPASPDPINPPNSEAAPALEVARGAPAEVLDQLLATAKATEDESLRDPANPDEPLDLTDVSDGSDLVGAPVALGTDELVPHSYTTVVWHFRLLSLAGTALLWLVMGVVLGYLLDRKVAQDTAERATATAGV